MRLLAYLRSLAARFLRPSQTEADLDDELRSHIEFRANDLVRSGMDYAAAERRARIEFGGGARFKEESREALGANLLHVFIQDLRFCSRVLRKSPAFTLVAVVTLAVAIGANAVVFGVLNGLILRPLEVPQPQSLYGIEHANEHSMYEGYPDYLDLRDRNRSFDGLAGFQITEVGLDTGSDAVQSWAYVTTANYFEALRLHPHIGRLFETADDRGPNSAPYVILSHSYWHNRFQEDRGVIGRTVRVNKYPFTVIGVAPPGFHGTLAFGAPAIYLPIAHQEQIEGKNTLAARDQHGALFMTLGHLKPGVTPQQAAADLNGIGAYLAKTYPTTHGATTFVLARPGLYGNYLGPPMRAFVTGLMLLAGLILLAACANLGGLFAARAADRAREMALRLALGATRSRIVRQLLTEALLISLAGGVLGLWSSVALLQALVRWQPFPKFPIVVPVVPDSSVYFFALILALASGLLFGLVPVRQVLRASAYQVVKSGSIGKVSRRFTVREFLLVAQVAICAVLVTSSLVAVRGLARSLNARFGFEPRNVLLAETYLSMSGYRSDQVPAIQKRMLDALQAIPGVESAALADRVPMNGGGAGTQIFDDQTTDFRPEKALGGAFTFNTSPGYLRAAGTALLAGRDFSWHDDHSTPPVAIVSRAFAAKVFGGVANAVGGHFQVRSGERVEVVGVVEDGKYHHLNEEPEIALFRPILQAPTTETTLVVRSAHDPGQLAAATRAALRAIDPALPVYIESWNQQLNFALFPSRVATVALGVLGGMGALLAVTGIFGMAAYSLSKRLKELGIRMALGAHRNAVLRTALGRSFQLLAIGSASGLLLGILAGRVLASIVYEATPRDPVVLSGVVLAMLALGVIATWIPAHRALSLDPLTLLREE